jgi:hypothetical protein
MKWLDEVPPYSLASVDEVEEGVRPARVARVAPGA